MSPGITGVSGKGNGEEGLDMRNISQEFPEPLDRLKTENEKEDLKMPA